MNELMVKLFGLDVATDLYLGFDYGIIANLTIGIGRSKFNEPYITLIKYRLLKQNETSHIFGSTPINQNYTISKTHWKKLDSINSI
ncbi:DUF5777 family beta-barrel protein [Flavobacteriaceae bacterium KMM 6898]|nr:DUF5777 family beta-barrel protein [Flavobacteriaceae bacterium KMM 6898]